MNHGGFRELYEYIAGMSYESLPQRVIDLAKLCLIDTIGIMIGASRVDVGKKLIGLGDVFEVSGSSASIIGTNQKASLMQAAFINGSLAEVLEMQDGIRYGGVHPSSTVIPAVIAFAQKRKSSGKDLILSIFAGYEFLGRMGRLVYPQPLWKGFNMTGVCGGFGAAIGCSKLSGYNAEKMANAVGICGMYAPLSSRESFFTEAKPTHAGRAAESGLLSVLVTEKGFQCSRQVLETTGRGGICTSLIADCKDFAQVSESLGNHFELEEVYFKPFPSCRHTHGAIQCTIELLEEYCIKHEDIYEVKVSTYDVAKSSVGDRRPTQKSPCFARQFSIPYVVSACLINGKFQRGEIFGHSSQDPMTYDFMSRVKVEEDTKMTNCYPEITPSSVEIILNGGMRLNKLIEMPKGDPRNPLTQEELKIKFRKLVAEVISEKETGILLSDLLDIEKINDVSQLLDEIVVEDGFYN